MKTIEQLDEKTLLSTAFNVWFWDLNRQGIVTIGFVGKVGRDFIDEMMSKGYVSVYRQGCTLRQIPNEFVISPKGLKQGAVFCS